jgi:predicted TIM-barrel fold metal-dependent hydrolase
MIDCDVHNEVPRPEALFPYLPEYWIEHITNTLFKGPTEPPYPPGSPVAARPQTRPDPDAPPGSDLGLLTRQVLDEPNVDVAILNCLYAIDSLHNPDAAIALASAVNDWQVSEWLEKDKRLRASIVVPSQLPAQAAREIERVAEQRGFVQVLLPARSQHPYGSRLFHPLWEAAARHDLRVAIHFGGSPGNPPTPSGWPSYFFEEYAGMAQVFATQLTSMISEGVFDQFPSLRVVLLESGFTWLPAHMWRFDKEWRNLRRLVPWVKQAPSAYIREHVRVTIQPLDAPPEPRHLLQVVDQLGSEDMLMYASDYPHVHAADAEATLLQHLPDGLANKIRHANAAAFYNL